jgi:hypothetical protein
VAKALRVTPVEAAALAKGRYGRGLAAEREARLAERQKADEHLDVRGLRSAIGRELVAELRADVSTRATRTTRPRRRG